MLLKDGANMEILDIVGRSRGLFGRDMDVYSGQISELVRNSKFLVIGGAGSIGSAVCIEIFKRNPKLLHVVDISENNLVELVRTLRSTVGYIDGDFQTYAVDCGGVEFEALIKANDAYDYVLNLSALKHVRSESDPFTLMRMLVTNVSNTVRTHQLVEASGCENYFCVSTDKAANPVNMMGASKRIMELFMNRPGIRSRITMARFANVAFSDGSLLHGFRQRVAARQPLSAPKDVRRYFLIQPESGELCLMAALLGNNREIFFPKLKDELVLTRFSDIAIRFLEDQGYEALICGSEEEARSCIEMVAAEKKWPCYFFESDTTGEKDFEEFYTGTEQIDWDRFYSLGVISGEESSSHLSFDLFETKLQKMRSGADWTKSDILDLYKLLLPNFGHLETGKYLDQRM